MIELLEKIGKVFKKNNQYKEKFIIIPRTHKDIEKNYYYHNCGVQLAETCTSECVGIT